MSMTSSRPYLVRALYEWIIDNQCTPYVLVNAFYDQVMVPQDHVNPDGQIVLNISVSAVNDMKMDSDSLHFFARFGGVPTEIFIPIAAVMGIYAKENQQGMIFDMESVPPSEPDPPEPGSTPTSKSNSKSRPSLKIVK